jgi:hypothetical protein
MKVGQTEACGQPVWPFHHNRTSRPCSITAKHDLSTSSVETVTKRQNHKLQQTKSLALTHLVIHALAQGEKSRLRKVKNRFGIIYSWLA